MAPIPTPSNPHEGGAEKLSHAPDSRNYVLTFDPNQGTLRQQVKERPDTQTSKDLDIMDFGLEEENYTFTIALGLAGVLALALSLLIYGALYVPLYHFSSTVVASVVVLFTYILGRHYILVKERGRFVKLVFNFVKHDGEHQMQPDTSRVSSVYFLYVLGSGGHTSEMCSMIRCHYRGYANIHRRYVISAGDTHSPFEIRRLESTILDAYRESGLQGTFDTFQIERARAVHQSWLTTPLTTLRSALHVIGALTCLPKARANHTAFGFPHVIFTNGPGTGFIVGLVAHLLKIFYLVPQNRLKVVYVETWAHTSTLSLTGKLFYFTNIADIFLAQHESLAASHGLQYVGNVVKRTNIGRLTQWGWYTPLPKMEGNLIRSLSEARVASMVASGVATLEGEARVKQHGRA